MTVYGTHDIDSPFHSVATMRSGSVPSSPAESPVSGRHLVDLSKLVSKNSSLEIKIVSDNTESLPFCVL